MKVKVENCWNGGNRYEFRLTMPNGERVVMPKAEGDRWNRTYASLALDLIESYYKVKRRSVRFV